ncbi:entericidin A/B family lipoprotein [Sedimentisphaera salicampi]|uniref:Putative small secreted protein n=1 Tax=Sedimentisphaera salicampi TaxID=1941349 RepID=A0A1W6LLS5_9BACT|nr:entericidin A/B family lipoprotein [Sedimentisphaera salicampi]ARN56715.1 putative small secreted protein [Sedimentisphaera salicampi]OXU15156.1 putative small secreted protein [Sedimentisphaera salicampi]
MKKILTILAAMMIIVSVSGCNTFEGLGEDIERAGESMQGAAD